MTVTHKKESYTLECKRLRIGFDLIKSSFQSLKMKKQTLLFNKIKKILTQAQIEVNF